MLKRHIKTIVIEEHVPNGGLSSRIKEIAFTNKINADVKFFTLKDKFIHFYGSYEQLLDKHGISFNKILKNIK